MEQRQVELGSAFPAGADAAPVVQPGVGAFDRPAVAAVGVGRLGAALAAAPDERRVVGGRLVPAAAFADHRLDPAGAQLLTQPVGVIAAIGPQLDGSQSTREQLVDQGQQMPAFVLVAGGQPDRERDAGSIDD